MNKNALPELINCNLASAILYLKELKIDDIVKFGFIYIPGIYIMIFLF